MTVVTKAKGGKEDLELYDGVNTTFSRLDSAGGTQTITKLNEFVDVLNVYGSGINKTRGTLDSAISRIGSNTVTLFIAPGTWTIDDDITFPANIKIKFLFGAVFNVSSGKTVTINGPIERERNAIFTGSGSYTLSSLAKSSLPTVLHETLADAKADATIIIGEKIQTVEHTSGYGNTGANLYTVRAVTVATDDNGSVIKSTGNTAVELVGVFPNGVHVDQFGAGGGVGVDTTAIQNANAYSYFIIFGQGPYYIEDILLIADKGSRSTSATGIGSNWFFNSTKFIVAGTLGSTEQPVIEIGINTNMTGTLTIDGQKSAGGHSNITAIRFGHEQTASEPFPGIIDAAWQNSIDKVIVYDCNRGIDLHSDGNSGVYYNTVKSAIIRDCTVGLQLRTSSGALNKVNVNCFETLSIQNCTFNCDIKGVTSAFFGAVSFENATTMNCTLEDCEQIYFAGGFMENTDDAEGITNVSNTTPIVITVDGSGKRSNAETVRITGTGISAIDNTIQTLQNVSGNTYELQGTTASGTSSTGNCFLSPGKNLDIKSTAEGLFFGCAIANDEDIKGYSYAAGRTVRLDSIDVSYNLGKTVFERLDVGTNNGVGILPQTDHDLGKGDYLRVAGGMWTYRYSTGVPFFLFDAPSVPSGNEVSWMFRNGGSTNRFRIRHDANIGIGAASANTNTPSGATAYQMPWYDASNNLLGYVPVYGAAW
jgi:hypothetical protein